ncbi:MAG: hypothetical protein Hens3KO_17890 [Henriciella sp.]
MMKKARFVLQAVIIIGTGIAALVAFTTAADAQTPSDICQMTQPNGTGCDAVAKA